MPEGEITLNLRVCNRDGRFHISYTYDGRVEGGTCDTKQDAREIILRAIEYFFYKAESRG
jgi:hypothetical protein